MDIAEDLDMSLFAIETTNSTVDAIVAAANAAGAVAGAVAADTCVAADITVGEDVVGKLVEFLALLGC